MPEDPGDDVEFVGDDDPELAAFFAGEDLSAPEPVPDGGKPDAGCPEGS